MEGASWEGEGGGENCPQEAARSSPGGCPAQAVWVAEDRARACVCVCACVHVQC